MKRHQRWIYFVAAVLLIGGLWWKFRPQPIKSDLFTEKDEQLLERWAALPYIEIAPSQEFRGFVDSIPVELKATTTLEQEEKLRATIYETLNILRSGKLSDFLAFQKKREQLKYSDTYVRKIAVERGLSGEGAIERVYQSIWDDIYEDGHGFVEAVSTTSTKITLLSKPRGASTRKVIRPVVDEQFENNAVVGFTDGNLHIIDNDRLNANPSTTVAVLTTTFRFPKPTPAMAWMIVYEWDAAVQEWVIVLHRRFFMGPSAGHFPFL